MDFRAKRKEQLGIRSLGDLRRSNVIVSDIDPSKYVNGPIVFDCLHRVWMSSGDMTGILAGPGVGKTTVILYILKHILQNNKKGIVAFVSLEMSADEIAEKWEKATFDQPELSDRFFIVENYDEKGVAKSLSVSDVKHQLKLIKEGTGEKLIAYALDHLHELNVNGSNDYNPVCRDLKNLTVELDTHGFILSQTTKGKGIGDIPVPKDGCFGTSRYENLMTNIITIFQPLKRVSSQCNLPVLGWQYAKIRYKNKEDKVKEGMNYCLMFDFETEDLRELTNSEKTEFMMWYEQVQELRQNEEKFKAFQFDLSDNIKTKDGKEVRLAKVFGGTPTEKEETDAQYASRTSGRSFRR